MTAEDLGSVKNFRTFGKFFRLGTCLESQIFGATDQFPFSAIFSSISCFVLSFSDARL